MAHGRLVVSDMDESLRLDYDQTTDLVRTLTDVRFKLLAFVPTISGAADGNGRPLPGDGSRS
jgi:hypothetical protein